MRPVACAGISRGRAPTDLARRRGSGGSSPQAAESGFALAARPAGGAVGGAPGRAAALKVAGQRARRAAAPAPARGRHEIDWMHAQDRSRSAAGWPVCRVAVRSFGLTGRPPCLAGVRGRPGARTLPPARCKVGEGAVGLCQKRVVAVPETVTIVTESAAGQAGMGGGA